jgi:hypothetical protein
MPISSTEHFLGLDMLQCSQGFQHAPSISLEAESASNLSEDCGLFVDAQVHEEQSLEFNGSAEAAGPAPMMATRRRFSVIFLFLGLAQCSRGAARKASSFMVVHEPRVDWTRVSSLYFLFSSRVTTSVLLYAFRAPSQNYGGFGSDES